MAGCKHRVEGEDAEGAPWSGGVVEVAGSGLVDLRPWLGAAGLAESFQICWPSCGDG